jgi:hypothetical protein
MMAAMCGALLLIAWRSSRRDVRRTEFWSIFAARNPDVLARGDVARIQATARRLWRERLLWHAERIGIAALVLWAGAGVAALVRGWG